MLVVRRKAAKPEREQLFQRPSEETRKTARGGALNHKPYARSLAARSLLVVRGRAAKPEREQLFQRNGEETRKRLVCDIYLP